MPTVRHGPGDDAGELDPGSGAGPGRASERARARPFVAWGTWAACGALVSFGALLALRLTVEGSWGWDESMHAELPAVRMLLAAREGELGASFRVLLECQRYPFVGPVVLAALQAAFGISETVCRAGATGLWCLTLVGTFLVGLRAVRGGPDVRGRLRRWSGPWIASFLALSSPLGLAYSRTLFLEVPFACAAIFTVRAWMRSAEREDRRAAVLAGGWLALAFFVKFNYGALLALALALDWILEAFLTSRRGEARRVLRRGPWLALVPVLATAWWFVVPLPGGFEIAASHRAAFADFLAGNQEMARTPWTTRVLYAAGYLSASPALFGFAILGALASLRRVRERGVRLLWIVFVVGAAPILLHPFHLDRFLLPFAPAFWILAGCGWQALAVRSRPACAAVLVALAPLLLEAPRQTEWLAARLGVLPEEGPAREYARSVFQGWNGTVSGRVVPTAGLRREEAARLLDLVAAELGPDERCGWLGLSSELSPAGVHLGLLARGGSAARFLRDAERPMDVTAVPGAPDPGWGAAELAVFADGFDVLFLTDPSDLKDRADRRALGRRYRELLTTDLGWGAKRLGSVRVERPASEPLDVWLFAARRP